MGNDSDAIISIHPVYVDAILSGLKTTELRRRVPYVPSGTRLWIYATRPVSAIMGYVTIASVTRAKPKTIWSLHRDSVAVNYASFAEYFEGAQEAIAISLVDARRVSPMGLKQIRKIRRKFHPPQVLLSLSPAESTALRVAVSASPEYAHPDRSPESFEYQS